MQTPVLTYLWLRLRHHEVWSFGIGNRHLDHTTISSQNDKALDTISNRDESLRHELTLPQEQGILDMSSAIAIDRMVGFARGFVA